jgi:hypothetical protein
VSPGKTGVTRFQAARKGSRFDATPPGMDRVFTRLPFGNQATFGSGVGYTEGPWLCAPASRRVCPFEEKGVCALECCRSVSNS